MIPSNLPQRRPDSDIEPPALFRFQTTLSGPERLAMRHPGELPWLIIGILLTLLTYLFAIFLVVSMVMGIQVDDGDGGNTITQLLLFVTLLPLLIFVSRALMYAQLRVNSVRMSPTQFPEAYRMVCEAALQQGLRRVPDAYVVLGNGQINAFAAGHGFRRFVAVYSDLFEIGGQARDPDALRFIIGHEVGHISAGHTSYFRLIFTTALNQIPVLSGFLSRAQEYTADNHGYRYRPEGALGAMRVLAAGKYLNVDVNSNEFADRATTDYGFWVWVSNLLQSHPVLTWRTQALRDRSRPGSLFLRPKFNPSGIGSLPGGGEPTERWPTPGEALQFLDTYPPTGRPQFGANFPVPLPGTDLSPGQGYGARQLRNRWAHPQPMQGGGWGQGPTPGDPGPYQQGSSWPGQQPPGATGQGSPGGSDGQPPAGPSGPDRPGGFPY